MMIIGCDFHPSWQQVSWLDSETGEAGEQKLVHASGDARRFYQALAAPALIGMEATGNSQWFVELVEDMGHEIWIGAAAQIRASYVRKQKTDKRDAGHILKLVVQGRFPRLLAPDREQRDLRALGRNVPQFFRVDHARQSFIHARSAGRWRARIAEIPSALTSGQAFSQTTREMGHPAMPL
jgi:transposase